MEFDIRPESHGYTSGIAGGFGFPEYSQASAAELLGLMSQADSVRRRAEGYLVGLVVCYGELEGRSAAATVCHQFGISAYRARRLAKTAEQLAGMPDVLGAVQQGDISAEQGGLVAESHTRAPMSQQDQQDLLALGAWQGHDEFKKSLAADEDRRLAEGGMSRSERQQACRSTKIGDRSDGMAVLHSEMDKIAGERVKIALGAMCDKMLLDDAAFDPGRTFEQRATDALVALITQQPAQAPETTVLASGIDGTGGNPASSFDLALAEEACNHRPQKTTLVIAADYDAIENKLTSTGLIDGTPIDLDEIRLLACNADILPMIFTADNQPIYVGRAQRAPTKAQLLALYRRDRGCVGCGLRPQVCEAHHIVPWHNNGPTNTDNLVLLCPKCHNKVHKHGHLIARCRKCGRFTLQPPPRHSLPPPQQPPESRPLPA